MTVSSFITDNTHLLTSYFLDCLDHQSRACFISTIQHLYTLACLYRLQRTDCVHTLQSSLGQSVNQSINLCRAIVQRHVLQCGYVESRRNVLRCILNVLTDGAVRQFSGREFQSLGAATEKRRAAVSKLCGGTDRSFCVDDRSKRD